MSSSKQKRVLQTWNEQNMQEAVKMIQMKKMGYLKASHIYKVPRTTLYRYCKKTEPKKERKGRKPTLPENLENELVSYLLYMEKQFFGLTRLDVRSLGYQLAAKNSIPNKFNVLHEIAGKDWLKRFLKRHPNLSIRKPTGTSIARATGFNKQEVDTFFTLLENLMEEKNFSPNRIFNVDESGLCIVPSKFPEAISLKGKRQVGTLTSAERGSLVTVVLCMSAGGTFIPAMLIFPRKNGSEQLKRGAPPGTLFAFHPSGWIQLHLFTQWFEHFIEHVRPTESQPVLLILDGHNSHTRNIDVILKARENFVTILCLPPHTTHKLQPLDKTVMGSLKTYYNEELRIFMRTTGRAVTHYDLSEIFGRAYLKIQSGERAVNGFSMTGIYPTRRDVFRDEDFVTLEQVEGEENEISINGSNLVSLNESTTANIVRPVDILTPPILRKKKGSRGRKSGKSRVITASPYKKDLENSLIKSLKLKNKQSEKVKIVKKGSLMKENLESTENLDKPGPSGIKRIAKNKKNLKRCLSPVSSDEDTTISIQDFSDDEEFIIQGSPENDAECIFCSQKFSEDHRGEIWVRCIVCLLWAHEECSGSDKEVYICDFCSAN